MYIKHQLDKIMVSLDVDGKNTLLIALSKNGDIARKGNGNRNAEMPLLQGFSHLQHFDALMMTISEDTFAYTGVYEQQPYIGRFCQLIIVCNGGSNVEAGFKVNYGEDSLGPPRELAEIVINAVKITDQWYNDEIKKNETVTTAAFNQTKAWWEFWK